MLSYYLLAALPIQALAQVLRTISGFASGVTGGRDVTHAVPSDTAELVEWLIDDTPRIIMLDKTYDFLEAEGRATETGCSPDSNTCGSSGQNALDGPNWCSDSYPAVGITYYVAPTEPIDTKGDKSIIGVGDKGIIGAKGIRFVNDVSNIIIQNIHFTELSPRYIWGGNAIQMSGADLVWIDHCKFSLIGRQVIVTGYESAVNISNNEFDGQTSWSASCNGDHYWTMLFLGAGNRITLANNYIHDVSGRAPDAIGRSCVQNSLADSGTFDDYTDSGAHSAFSSADSIREPVAVDGVASSVLANAGIEKLSSSSSSSETDSTEVTSSSAAVATRSFKATSLATVVKTSTAAAAAKATSSAVTTKASMTTTEKRMPFTPTHGEVSKVLFSNLYCHE